MKDITSNESLVVPEGVTVTLKARNITVEGPRGKLVKNVGHVAMDLQLVSRRCGHIGDGIEREPEEKFGAWSDLGSWRSSEEQDAQDEKECEGGCQRIRRKPKP